MPLCFSFLRGFDDFSGAEFDVSGAEDSDSDSDAWRAQFRSGSLSPPPPDYVTFFFHSLIWKHLIFLIFLVKVQRKAT